jgi:ferredoxin-NADP reductase
MSEFAVRILNIEEVTHDVKRFEIEKPDGYTFVPGQATEVAINKPEWKNEKRPFTFTSLNEWPYLEFTIKAYSSHKGVTDQLHKLSVGDELLIHDVWGAISYKGKGVFIAGGAGITPFIAIFRQLDKDNSIKGNKLIFSNKTSRDIIMRDEFEKMLGEDFINVLTDESVPGIHNKRIDKDYLKETIKDFNQHFYVCGPEKFTEAITDALVSLGAKVDEVVLEK